jgi:lipopolysaccharide transport system ATP-binding protein
VSMSDIAIRVESLGKRYRIGVGRQGLFGYRSLRETISGSAAAAFRRLTGWINPSQQTGGVRNDFLWALKDISFEVKSGEVVGIIGKNGAGKSTLLKILSRITQPTEGQAYFHGRVGALLQVGTGFHPELTGRENIFLNGAILGMHRSEISQKFDEIVDFSEIEKFLDTPVKHYSSGMYVRLAFAVAATSIPRFSWWMKCSR